MFSLSDSGAESSFKGSIISTTSSTTSLLSINSLKYASIRGAYFSITGVILELFIMKMPALLENEEE